MRCNYSTMHNFTEYVVLIIHWSSLYSFLYNDSCIVYIAYFYTRSYGIKYIMHDVRKQVDMSSSDNCDINKPEGVDIRGRYGFVNNIWMRTMAVQLYATGTTVVSIIITIRISTVADVAVGIVVIMLSRHDMFKIYYFIDWGLVTRLCVN